MRSNVLEQAELFDAPEWGKEVCMAVTKAIKVPRKKPDPPNVGPAKKKAEDRNKPIIATLRGSLEFKAFLEKAAKTDRLSVADFLERAAVRYARELGLTEDVPER